MKRLLWLLVATGLFAQADEILYDWAGQYGYLINDGMVVWNQDASIGALRLDGTFNAYPRRFGPSVSERWRFLNTSSFWFKYSLPDSEVVKSRIVNSRGDYYLNDLDLSLDFGSKSRRITLTGFKRTFAGTYGQYFSPSSPNPLQQAYLLNYTGGTKNDTLGITIGRFLTNSGLWDTSATNAGLTDNITSAGVTWIRQGNAGRLETNISPNFERYSGYWSFTGGRFNMRISRLYVHQSWIRKSGGLFSGLEWEWTNWQNNPDSTLTSSRRFTVGILNTIGKNIRANVGVTGMAGYIYPAVDFRWDAVFGSFAQKIVYASELRQGLDFKTHGILAEYWNRTGYELTLPLKWFTFGISNRISWVVGLSPSAGLQGLFGSGTAPGSWEVGGRVEFHPHPVFSLSSQWTHYTNTSDLAPGYGNKLTEEIRSRMLLFNKHMDLKTHLQINGYFNRRNDFYYNPVFPEVRIRTGSQPFNRDPLWIISFVADAKVSSMTISWSIDNVAVLFGNPANNMITWNKRFQPIGRLSQFRVDWWFKN